MPRLDRCTELDDAEYERKLLSQLSLKAKRPSLLMSATQSGAPSPPTREESVNEQAKIGGTDRIAEEGRRRASHRPWRGAGSGRASSLLPRKKTPAQPAPAALERIVEQRPYTRNAPEGRNNKERRSEPSSSGGLETTYEEDSQEGPRPSRPCCGELGRVAKPPP